MNKSQRVTPFWHNDTRSRVTVTFGARRLDVPSGVALDVFCASQGDGLRLFVSQAILDLILDIERGGNPETARVKNEDA
jgi:hypothetical protein